MNRTIETKRLYSLGDYRNITFTDLIEDIPAEVALNGEAMAKLRILQMVGVELAFNKYLELKKVLDKEEDIATKLEQMRDTYLTELKTILNGNLTKE